MANIMLSGSSSISITNGSKKAIVNGKEYPFIKGMNGNNITQINNKIYVDGYELKNGKWKKTLAAFWHKLF